MEERPTGMSILGTRWAFTPHGEWRSKGLLRLRKEYVELSPQRFLDWTVDGEPIRDWFASAEGERHEITWMVEGFPGEAAAVASLRALLVDSRSSPRSDVRFGDGRVGLLYCPGCYDLACGALSAEVRVTDDSVEWRDITYQDAIADELWAEMPRRSVTFERRAYEATVRELLATWG